jgi:hypothetical protein
MNVRELQQSYENRIKNIRPFIYKQTRENQDLRYYYYFTNLRLLKQLLCPSIQNNRL